MGGDVPVWPLALGILNTRDCRMTPEQWRERFDALVARKTDEAVRAAMPPYVTETTRHDERLTAIGNAWSTEHFDGPFYMTRTAEARPVCSLVFVQSADGNTGARNPTALGGGETDKHLIYEGLSRVAADAVFGGAETLRDSALVLSVWHPQLVELRTSLRLPRHPIQIVATERGVDVDSMLLFNVPEIRVVLVTVPSVAERLRDALRLRPWVSIIAMRRHEGLRSAFEEMARMGIRRVSCIGGRTLAAKLLDAGLVDEIYLTTAPRPGGEPNTPISPRPWRGALILRKHGSGPEQGVVFEHLLPRVDVPSASVFTGPA
jgi:riboflavin biosynthesis pyrimidine reductase